MSKELELGKLCLAIAKSDLELVSTTSAVFSRPENLFDLSEPALDIHTLGHAWVQRGRGLRLEIKVLVDGTPPTSADLQILSGILCRAKSWFQLGLKATPIALEDHLSKCAINDTVTIGLSYDPYTRDQPKDTIHRLCYTIPATDVAPPAGVDVLGLDAVKLDLDIRRKTQRRRQRRRKSTKPKNDRKADVAESDMIFEPLLLTAFGESVVLPCSQSDSGYSSLFSAQESQSDEEMLLEGPGPNEEDEDMLDFSVDSTSSHTQIDQVTQSSYAPPLVNPKKRPASVHDENDEVEPAVIQSSCITSLVDAVLRLSIEEKPRRLPQGIRIKSNDVQPRLSDISPALWSPGYSQEISTRAPLLSTVAHTLSHSIYTNAKSPALKMKLHRLLYYGVDDADGEMDCDEGIIVGSEIAPRSRFKLMSTLLWHVMQKQLYQPDAARRLKNLTQGAETTKEPGKDDEELFPQSSEEHARRDLDHFMFDDDEEDMMEYENIDDNNDGGFLFETGHYWNDGGDGDEGEDLFHGHDTTVERDEDDLLLQDLDW